MSGSIVKIQGHPTRRQVITVAVAHSVATRSCVPQRTEDVPGQPKAITAT
ncbi:MAG: hypothetical protein PHD43_24040 [Methylococcales bacterium]|nr:hypothetical protein [Methylococcales bacterium]